MLTVPNNLKWSRITHILGKVGILVVHFAEPQGSASVAVVWNEEVYIPRDSSSQSEPPSVFHLICSFSYDFSIKPRVYFKIK